MLPYGLQEDREVLRFRKPSFDSACSGRNPAKISRNPPDTWNFKMLAVKLTE